MGDGIKLFFTWLKDTIWLSLTIKEGPPPPIEVDEKGRPKVSPPSDPAQTIWDGPGDFGGGD